MEYVICLLIVIIIVQLTMVCAVCVHLSPIWLVTKWLLFVLGCSLSLCVMA